MGHVRKRPSAKRDLVAQWVWYAEHADLETADRFLAAVESTVGLLATQPRSGREIIAKRAELQGLRRFPVAGGFEQFFVVYLPLPNGIELLRIIHGSRDLEALLREGFSTP